MKRYNPREIEAKWQKQWLDQKAYIVDDNDPRPKFYHLVEFPYPSGVGLHVGHCRPYITFDIMSRWRRMNGENVLYPMGWDSFGLPAEQYALKTGVHPSETTKTNIDNFRNQAQSLGLSFDWSREFSTTDPEYYKWTQWIFLNLFKHGLAYQAESVVWWCEDLKSVLADEEVIDGRSERGDFPCERRPLRQWMLAITKYADRLYDDLDDVDYIEPVKVQQRNWIGRSKGAEVDFLLENTNDKITVFTTRPDTLFGVTYLVLAPEHPLVKSVTNSQQKAKVEAYISQTASKSELTRQEDAKDKTGVFTGAFATNPINKQKIPIWISDYVLMSYGTGAIMAVPAHDQRDYEFAKKFELPIINVVNPSSIRSDSKEATDFTKNEKIVAVVVNDKSEILTINWGPKMGGRLLIGGTVENGESVEETALREVTEETGYTDLDLLEIGGETYNYKYFAFSKQKHFEVDCRFIFFKLKNDKKVEQKLDNSEKGNFKVEWVPFELAEKEITEPLHQYAFNKFVLGKCYGGEGLMVNSGKYGGEASSVAREKIVAELETNGLAKEVTNYKMRDWVFSRQRYWGEPFPIIWIKSDDVNLTSDEVDKWLPERSVTKNIAGVEHTAMPVPPNSLPVVLPEVEDFTPKGLGKGPLAEAEEWVHVWYNLSTGETKPFSNSRPEGENWAEGSRETDTMPNWAGSSWYFLRYLDPHNDNDLADIKKIEEWMPVSWYNGGMEHTTLHLLYSRFWHKFLYDIGAVNTSEPYLKRTSHGLVLSADGRKMSKSWGNVVDPMEIVNDYGADTLRLYIAFIGPFDQTVAWNVSGVAGCRRFIERFWTIAQEFLESNPEKNLAEVIKDTRLRSLLAEANQRVTRDIPKLGFNTAVAALMEAVNGLYKIKESLPYAENVSDWYLTFKQMLILLAPFTPHLSEELWQEFGFEGDVLKHEWLRSDAEALVKDTKIIIIQVNGKLRGQIEVADNLAEPEIIELAKAEPKTVEYLSSKTITRSIYVPNKLVNFVVK
jgi:leucyl-tRNA synthetase